MNEYLKQFDNCLQHEVSFCAASCPFNLDVNAFISRIQEGRFNAAYKTYRDATGFPFIAQKLCTEPCKSSCLKNAVATGADPIELLKLEEACLAYVKRKDPTNYNVPGKNKAIAIIGAGISGMACALRMATKKYNVTIYESSNTTGGMLLDILDYNDIQKEFNLQMQHLDYKLKLNTEIKSLEEVIELGKEESKAAIDPALAAVAAVMRSASINANKTASATYDAIYVATGEDGDTFGYDLEELTRVNGGPCTLIGETAVFFGGSLTGADPIHALADGLRMSTAIDNYTMTKLLKYPVYPTTDIAIDETAMVTGKAVGASANATEARDTGGTCDSENTWDSGAAKGTLYTQEEATAEAKRCMKCQCNACQLHCDLTEYLHKWPLRLKDEVIATTAPGKSELHATPAVRTINTCTHCGLCKDTCPEDIDMDGLFQAARIRMHKLDKMPWAFNDFFIRDMNFTNSEAAYISRKGPGASSNTSGNDIAVEGMPKYAFFPGCQLGASSPELVLRSYEYLLDLDSSTGIMLGCCGMPAQWAGNEDLHESVLSRIRADWEALGKPIMVLACPTCKKSFSRFLPEIETVFIYEIMAEHGICKDQRSGKHGDGFVEDAGAFVEMPADHHTCASDFARYETASVFDPCATVAGDSVRDSVRKICEDMNVKLVPLPVQEKWTACCSYGGHGQIADPDFAKFVRDKRIEESDEPYITYCINCRDAFMHEGKEAAHILNLVFGIKPQLETVTSRRENRIKLKESLMKNIWNEPLTEEDAAKAKSALTSGDGDKVALIISDEVKHKLSEEFILEQEACDVVSFCERTGRTLYDERADSYTGYRKIGNLTYWVEYRKTSNSDEFELLNAYSHRMEIELEMVWNGKKIEIDM